jgi:hypothetical protein
MITTLLQRYACKIALACQSSAYGLAAIVEHTNKSDSITGPDKVHQGIEHMCRQYMGRLSLGDHGGGLLNFDKLLVR